MYDLKKNLDMFFIILCCLNMICCCTVTASLMFNQLAAASVQTAFLISVLATGKDS